MKCTNAPPVFLQTASAESLESFASAIPASRLSFTRNTNRADADGWGGWRTTQKAREVTAHGTVAAVNLWVGSQAAAVISPASSAWTNLLVGLVHGPRAGRALVATWPRIAPPKRPKGPRPRSAWYSSRVLPVCSMERGAGSGLCSTSNLTVLPASLRSHKRKLGPHFRCARTCHLTSGLALGQAAATWRAQKSGRRWTAW